MVAYLRLVHLEQVIKEFAERQNALRMTRQRMKVAKVFAVESAEDEVTVFFNIADVAKWGHENREMLDRQKTALREHTTCFVILIVHY